MEIFSRDKIREIIARPFPNEVSQMEFSDSVERGLKGILYAGGRFTFHARFTQNHRKISKVIGDFPDVSVVQARDFVRKLRAKAMCSVTVPFAQNITFGNLAEEFLEYSKCVHKSFETNLSRYRHHLQRTFGAMKISDIDKPRVTVFYEVLCRTQGVPLANRIINLMKSIMTYASDKGYIENSPLVSFKLKQEESKLLPSWSKEEASRFLSYWKGNLDSECSNLVAFLLLTGIRLGEAQNLTFENVDWDSPAIRLVETKSRKNRTLQISDSALNVLEIQRQRHTKSELVFLSTDGKGKISSPYRFLQRVCKDIGITPISPHGLRRTATTLFLNVTDIYQVKNILGHSHIQTTERYAKNTDDRLHQSVNDYADWLEE